MGNVPFYGPKTTNNAVTFDKTYPCHFIMINSANDGVFLGRYAFINYDDNLVNIELPTTKRTLLQSIGDYTINLQANETQITELQIINNQETEEDKKTVYNSENDANFQYYDLQFILTGEGNNIKRYYPKDLWYLIDLKGSGKTISQDSTIWQKVKSSNGIETYIQVAAWNGAAPNIEFVKIAPEDMGNNIDTYEINDLNYQVPYSLGWKLGTVSATFDDSNQYLTTDKVKNTPDITTKNLTINWETARDTQAEAGEYWKQNSNRSYTSETNTDTNDTKNLNLKIPAIGEAIGHMNYRIYGEDIGENSGNKKAWFSGKTGPQSLNEAIIEANDNIDTTITQANKEINKRIYGLDEKEEPEDWIVGDTGPQNINEAIGNMQNYADNAMKTYLNAYDHTYDEDGNIITEDTTIKAQDLINTYLNSYDETELENGEPIEGATIKAQDLINTYLNSCDDQIYDEDGNLIEDTIIKAQDLIDAHMNEQDNGYSQGQVYVNNNMYNNGPRLIRQYMQTDGQNLMNTYLSNNNNENANTLIQDYFNTNNQGQILINNKMDESGQEYINTYLNNDPDENGLTNAQELVNNHMNIINGDISNGQNYIKEHMQQEGQEYINNYLNSYEHIYDEDGNLIEEDTIIKAQDLVNNYMDNNDVSIIGEYLQENNKEQELIDNYLNSYNHIYDEDGNIITEDTTIKAQDLIGNYLQEERGQQNLNNLVKEHFNQPIDENDITSMTMGQQYAENYFNNKNFEQSDYKEQDEFLSSFIKNKPYGEILPYNGKLEIPMYTGNEVQSNIIELNSGINWYYIKIADIKNDHKTIAMALSKYEYTVSVEGITVTNNYSVDNEDIGKRIQKEYFENYSVCKIGTAGQDLIITEEKINYNPYPQYPQYNLNFDIPEPGIYVCAMMISYEDEEYLETRKGDLYFNIITKKIQEEYMPENYASKTYVDEVLNNVAMTGGQVQADYAETDDTKASYIHNKPEIDTKVTEDSTNLISSGAVFEAIDNIEILPSPTYDTRKFKDIENVPSYNTQEIPGDIVEAEIEQYANLDNPIYSVGVRYYKVANLPQDINLKEEVFNEISHFIEEYTNKETYITNDYNDYVMGQEVYIGIKQELYSRSVVYGIFLIKEKGVVFNSAYYKATFPEPGIYFLYVLANSEYIPFIKTLKFKGEYKKLDNDYLYIDETPIEKSKNLITSNAVFKVKEELTTNIEQIKKEYLTQENFNNFNEENNNKLTEQFAELQNQIDDNVGNIEKNIKDINILNNKSYIEIVEQLPEANDNNNNIIALNNNLNGIPFEQIKIDIKLRNDLKDSGGKIDLKKATIIKNVTIDNLFNMDPYDLDGTIQWGYDYIPNFSYEPGKTKSGLVIMDKSLKNGIKVLFNDIDVQGNYPQIELTHISYNEETQEKQEIQYYGFDSVVAPGGTPGWYKLQDNKYELIGKNDFSDLNFSEAYIFDYWAEASEEEYNAVPENYFIQYPLVVAPTLSCFVKFDIVEGFYKAFKDENTSLPIQWSLYNNANNDNTNVSNVLPDPIDLPDGTIPYVQNGQWTSIVLTFAEEGEF